MEYAIAVLNAIGIMPIVVGNRIVVSDCEAYEVVYQSLIQSDMPINEIGESFHSCGINTLFRMNGGWNDFFIEVIL